MAIGAPPRLLGEILVAEGLTSADAVDRALSRQRSTGELIGEALVAIGALNEDDVARALAVQQDLPYVWREELPSTVPVLKNVSAWAPPVPAPVDVKSVSWTKQRYHANWDGNQGASSRTLASGASATGDPRMVNVRIHEPLNPFIDNLPPPPYPFASIDLTRAKAHPGGRLRRLGTSAPFRETRFFVRVMVGSASGMAAMSAVEYGCAGSLTSGNFT